MAGANVRFDAKSVMPFAFYIAHRTTRESVRIHPITIVALAELDINAGAVDATICTHRHAQIFVVG